MSKRKQLERACLATDLQLQVVGRLLEQKADILTGIQAVSGWASKSDRLILDLDKAIVEIIAFDELLKKPETVALVTSKLVEVELATDQVMAELSSESHSDITIRIRSLVVCQDNLVREIMVLDNCLEAERKAAIVANRSLMKGRIRELLARSTEGFYAKASNMGYVIPPVALPL